MEKSVKNKIFSLALIMLLCSIRIAAQNVGYVVDNSTGQVKGGDLALRRTTATIPSGQGASEMLILPNNRGAFIANHTANNEAARDFSRNSLICTILTGQRPNSL